MYYVLTHVEENRDKVFIFEYLVPFFNEENEVVQVLHENITGWQTQEPQTTYLNDEQLSELKRLIEVYDDADTTDEQDDAKQAILDLI